MLPKYYSILLLSSGIAQALPHSDAAKTAKTTNTTGIKWGNCTEDFFTGTGQLVRAQANNLTCANLEVPLDYTDSGSKSISLQLVRRKASKKPSRGSVLLNPGGPGESGLEQVLGSGNSIDSVLGGHFDLVSFDPRGVGKTIPFECSTGETTNSTLKRRDDIVVNLPSVDIYDTLVQNWKQSGLLAEQCYKDNKETGRFISTAFVARDMLRIVDALDEDGLLRYWGTSYGTLLGQTFAAMFPDRIHRMLLDGNQAASDYYDGYDLTTLHDVGRALSFAFSQCIEIGVEKCSLAGYAGSNTTAEHLMLAYGELLQEMIDEDPDTTNNKYYNLLKSDIHHKLYGAENTVEVLKLIGLGLQRNWTALDENISSEGGEKGAKAGEGDDSDKENLALTAITCLDGAFRAKTPEDAYSLMMAQTELSPSFADMAIPTRDCPQWKFEAAERYEGHFRGINTSFPILFANGPYDAITPLVSAYQASAGFTGSRVLLHNGAGHGVLTHPSNCTIKAIREYFEDGLLPKVRTTCEPNQNLLEFAFAYSAEDSI